MGAVRTRTQAAGHRLRAAGTGAVCRLCVAGTGARLQQSIKYSRGQGAAGYRLAYEAAPAGRGGCSWLHLAGLL